MTDFGPGESELSQLKSTDDSALLDNARLRYEASHIYTRSGRLLLAINPYRPLKLYTKDILAQYKNSLHPQAELAPHVFAVAASAHMGMLQSSQSQARCLHDARAGPDARADGEGARRADAW